MKDGEKLYIKTLLWAYEKQGEGFTLEELKGNLGFNDREWEWWRKTFVTSNDNDRKLIDYFHYEEDGNRHRYTLNDKGMAAVVDYIELKEARESSKRAMYIAVASLALATIMSIASIVVQICFR